MTVVVVIGSTTLDICVDTDFTTVLPGRQTESEISITPGGGLPNVGRSLIDLGVEVTPIGVVGSDAIGTTIQQMLPWPIPAIKGARSEVSVISITGDRTILNQPGTALLRMKEADSMVPPGAMVVIAYLNSCSIAVAELGKLVENIRLKSPLVVAGLNGVFDSENRDNILGMIDYLDLLVMNATEACWIANTSLIKDAVAFVSGKMNQAIITFGKDGMLSLDHGTMVFLPAPEVPQVRTLGAGDAFLAGVASALASGKPFRDACDAGRIAASRWVSGSSVSRRSEFPLPSPVPVASVIFKS